MSETIYFAFVALIGLVLIIDGVLRAGQHDYMGFVECIGGGSLLGYQGSILFEKVTQ